MSILELLAKIGPENVQVQFLNQCLTGATSRPKLGGTEVKFMTNAMSPNDLVANSGNIGIVIWVPRDKWPKE